MRSKLFGRLMSFTLSATVALTSGIPALAYDGGGGDLPEDEEIQLLEEEEEIGSDFDVLEEDIVEDEEFLDVEEIEEAELESLEGASITFTNAQATSVDFYTVNGGTATKVVNQYSDNKKTVKVPTEQDYVIYAVPKVGSTISDATFTFAGAYTDASGTVHTITKNTDYTISDALGEYDVTGDSIPLQSVLEKTSFYWNKAKMITIKSSFLQAYENRKAEPATEDVAIGVTVAAPATTTFELPVYVYDDTEETSATYHKYSKVTRMTTPTLTYGTGRAEGTAIDIANAVSDSDWTTYDWTVKVAMLKADLSEDDGETTFSAGGNGWAIGSEADTYLYADKKMNLTNQATSTGYLANEKSLGTAFMAIILTKDTLAGNANYTISAEDTDYVDFTFEGSDTQSVARPNEAVTVLAAATDANNEIIAAAKDYDETVKALKLSDNNTAPSRALVAESGAILYSIDGEDPVAAWTDSKWTIPATPTGNVVLTAQTRESIDIKPSVVGMGSHITANFVSLNGVDNTDAIGLTSNDGKGAQYTGATGIKTGTDVKFTAYPKAGYTIDKVVVTRYNVAGTSMAENNVEITPVDGVYEVKNIKGYTIITIVASQMSSTILVKKADVANVTLTDVATNEQITTAGALLVEHGKDYYFKAAASDGYRIKEIKAVAGENESAVDCTVTYDSAKKQYKIAAVNVGPIVITPVMAPALKIVKKANTDAIVTIDGTAVDDADAITVDGDKAVSVGVTAKNNATITGVYYSTSNEITTNLALATAVTNGTAWKLSAANGSYIISANDVITRTGEGGKTIYVYVTTKRDAIQGLDYDSVEIIDVNETPNDVTSGLTLWASDGTTFLDNVKNRTLTARWIKDEEAIVTTATPSTTKIVTVAFAKTTEDTRIATIDGAVIKPGKYNGGSAATDSDVLSVGVTSVVAGETANFPQTVTYTADLNVTVKPLRDYYETYELDVATKNSADNDISALIGEKKIRVNDGSLADYAVFTPHGKIAATEETEAVDDTLAMNTRTVKASTGIKFTTTPKMKSASSLSEYTLAFGNGEAQTITNTGAADTVKIANAQKAQTINVEAALTFIDGTEATITDSVEVIEADYGYFAIPSITVNGTEKVAYSGAQDKALTMQLETTAGGIQTGKIGYDVYHALTAAGETAFTTYTLNSADAIATAINAGNIEAVDPSTVTWTDVVPPEGKEGFFTIAGSSGEYTVTAVKKTTTEGLSVGFKSAPKVGDMAVSLATGTSVTVKVAQKLARYNVTVNTSDTKAKEDYQYPSFTMSTGYTKSDILSETKVVGFALLNVPSGTAITLPGADAFTGIDPGRTLAGWKVGDTYKKIGDEIETANGTILTAIWAPKFSAATGSQAVTGNGAISGGILAVNAKTGKAITSASNNPLNVAVGEQVKVIAGYYPLDIEKAPTAAGEVVSVTYGTDLEYVEDTTKLELSTASAAEGKTFLGAGDDGKFAGSVLKGVEKMTNDSSIITSLKYTLAEDTEYVASNVYAAVTDAEVWKIEAADVSVESGQTITKVLTTLKEGAAEDSLEDVKLNNAKVADVKFTYSAEDVAVVSIADGDAANNKLTIKGLKEGSVDVTMTIISKGNVEKSATFKVTVTKALLDIVVEVTPKYEDSNKTPEAVTVAKGEAAKLLVGDAGNTVKIKLIDGDGAEVQTGLTFTETTFAAASEDEVNATVSVTNGTTATQTWKATALGTSKATINVKLTGQNREYTRVIDIVTYGVVKVTGQRTGDANKITITDQNKPVENTCFKVYEGTQVDDNAFADNKVAYVPVVYDATKKASDKYTVSLDSFSAKWINEAIEQSFLGWGATAPGIHKTAAVKKGETLKLTATQVTEGTSVFAYFTDVPIENIYGLPTEIRLTDEDVDGNITAADTRKAKDGTDWEEFNLIINPATANEDVKVISTESGILDIASVGQEGTAADYGKDTSAQVLYLATGTPWNGAETLSLGKKVNDAKTERIDNFRIGKVAGKVGVSTLYVETANLEIAPITVYLNGEFTDTTVTPNAVRYMEDGEIVKEGARVVDGVIHYYKDSAKITNGIVKIVVDGEEKLILVEGGVQIKVPKNGTRVFDGKTYYIDGDGYLKTGIITIDGKDYLFREDGSKVFYTDEDLGEDHTITVGDTTYVIAEDNTAEEDKLFTVAKSEWTWTKAADEKSYASAKVVFTATDGRTKEFTVLATETDTTAAKYMVVTPSEDYTEYKAYASFKSKDTTVEATDTQYLDSDGNEYVPHAGDHKYVETWTWADVANKPEVKVVTLHIECVEGGKAHAKHDFSAEITATKTGTTWTWKASFEQDGQIFTDSKTEFKNNEGEEVPVKEISGDLYIVGIDDEYGYGYTGSAIKPNFQVMELRENEEGTYEYWLVNGVDYKASFKNNTKVNYSREKEAYTGNPAEIKIEGKGNYSGKATSAQFKIVDPKEGWEEKDLANLKGAKLALSDTKFTYNGEEQFPKTITLTKKGGSPETYTWDEDEHTYKADGEYMPYPWAVSNNRKKGTATLTLWGSGNTKAKKNFTIAAAELTTGNLKIKVNGEESGAEVLWAAKGAVPDWVEVYMTVGSGDDARDVYLVEGEDYKLSYKNNKALGTATLTVTGKGNTKKSVKDAASFTVTAFDLSAEYVWIQGIQTTAGKNVKKVTMAIADTSMQHNLIPSKYYDIVVTDMDEKAVTGNLAAGEYLVKAVAKAGTPLTGETEARHITVANDLSKAKVKVASGFFKTFTGDGIWLTDDDMKNVTVTLKINGSTQTLVYGEDFYISGYRDNVKKGTMTVTIQGTENADDSHGAISGSKTFKVKIKAKALGTAKQ